MAPIRRERKATSIPLAQPDRSGPVPSNETLLDIARKRGILEVNDNDKPVEEEVLVGRIAESILWCLSLAMLHVTLDVLVQHQYTQDGLNGFDWRAVALRACKAFGVFFVLFYSFHQHAEPPLHLPSSKSLPSAIQKSLPILHQLLFFVGSVSTGCYLIYITNVYGYIAVMKNAPGIGCLWIWSVIELDLLWALPSLAVCLGFLRLGGYSYL